MNLKMPNRFLKISTLTAFAMMIVGCGAEIPNANPNVLACKAAGSCLVDNLVNGDNADTGTTGTVNPGPGNTDPMLLEITITAGNQKGPWNSDAAPAVIHSNYKIKFINNSGVAITFHGDGSFPHQNTSTATADGSFYQFTVGTAVNANSRFYNHFLGNGNLTGAKAFYFTFTP
jgi:hypothetical protein